MGKIENCVVSVHLGYTPEFYSLIDGELYLPEETFGTTTARGVARRGFPMTWSIDPSGRWRWSNTDGRWPTACGLPGWSSTRATAAKGLFAELEGAMR